MPFYLDVRMLTCMKKEFSAFNLGAMINYLNSI
jgi:hypothetical protein